MILVDSSVWIDFLRGVRSRARDELRELLADAAEVAVTEPVVMELLAGVTDEAALLKVELLTSGLPLLGVQPELDYRDAATIYRSARRSGRTVRRLNDCLIAAIAMRHHATLWHKDADFDVIATVVPLQVRSMYEGG